MNGDKVTYFDSFQVEHISKTIQKLIGNKHILASFHKIKTCTSLMCGYIIIKLIDLILKDKRLLHCTNLFSPNDYEKNDTIMQRYF